MPSQSAHLIFFLMLALMVSLAIIPAMIRLAPRFGMIDLPDPRKVHAKPIARVGGVGIVSGSILALVLALPMSPLLTAFLFGAMVLFVIGLIDDRADIGHYPKFLGQFLAVGVVIFVGDLWVQRVPFVPGGELPPSVGIPFTFVAMVGVINALNHSDGLDGLAGGEAMLSLMAMGLIAYWADDNLALGIALSSLGGLLGFLRYNNHPARVFMGDSGSQFLGFTIGFLALLLTQRSNTALSPALPTLLIGLPVIDILSVFYLRISGGMHWFKASRNHIHHRLLDLGFAHAESVVIIYAIQAFMVISAVLLRYHQDILVLSIYLGVAFVVLASLLVAERSGWRARQGKREGGLLNLSIFVGKSLSQRLSQTAVLLMVPAYFAFHGFAQPATEAWVNLFALAVASILMLSIFVERFDRSAITWLAAYSSVILIAYVHYVQGAGWQFLSSAFFFVFAVAIMIAVKTSSIETFRTTPLDYLIAMIVAGLILFHDELSLDEATSSAIIKSVIVLYGVEYLMNCTGHLPKISRAVIAVTLGSLALRGMV